MPYRFVAACIAQMLLTSVPMSHAQEYTLPEFCSTENMIPVRNSIEHSPKWQARLEASELARADQGQLDENVPETFDRRTETSPPLPQIPRAALKKSGSRGSCQILADIQPDGTATDLITECSHRRYKRNARNAVRGARFTPAFLNGEAVIKFGAIIPIDFCTHPYD